MPLAGRGLAKPSGRVLAAAAVLLAAHLPLLVSHGKVLWARPHYQFFPLVFVGAAALLWPVLSEFRTARLPAARGPATATPGFVLMAVSWTLLAVAVFLDSPWIAMASALGVLAAVPLGLGGWALFRRCLPAWLFLFLVLPPPFGLDGRLVSALQTITSRWSSRLLDLVGTFHVMSGNVLEIAGKRYFVEEACSGIHSLLSVLACTVFYVLWVRAYWLRAVLLVLAAAFWVVANNVARVFLIAFVGTRFHFDLSADPQHTVVGFALFGLTLGLVASTDRLLVFLGRRPRKELPRPARPEAPPAGPAAARPGWFGAWPATAAYVALALVQVGALPEFLDLTQYSGSQLSERFNALEVDALPERVGPWQRQGQSIEKRDSGDPFGEFSRVWRYQAGGLGAVVSLDFPFPAFHNLRDCYTGSGWVVQDLREFDHPLPGTDGPQRCVTFSMERPVVRHGSVWFGAFDAHGRPVIPASTRDVVDRFRRRLDFWGHDWPTVLRRPGGAPERGCVLQVQLLVERLAPLSEPERQEAQKLFETAFDSLRRQCVALTDGPH
jgi:exosortase